MAVNYLVASQILRLADGDDKGRSRVALAVGVGFNLTLLGYFRYTDFFIDSANSIFASDFGLLELALPLAISFFTFQQVAYLAEVYKGNVEEQTPLTYASFVSLFPQLIAGPIVYHSEMIPQLTQRRTIFPNFDNLSRGLIIIAIGLAKKVVIADTLASFSDYGFGNAGSLTMVEAWIATLSFSLQIYFDFSGYADMAIGLALLFNLKLPINFDRPYLSTGVQEFWRRWHITLGRFLRDYIYLPLGGNRHGLVATSRNVLVVFFIGGLWHGPAWTFVVWGMLQGVGIVAQGVAHQIGISVNRWVAWVATLLFMNFTWIFFRAESFGAATDVIRAMFNFSEGIVFATKFSGDRLAGVTSTFLHVEILGPALWVVLAFVLSVSVDTTWRAIGGWRFSPRTFFITAAVLSVAVVVMNWGSDREFIYFNF